MSRWFVLAACCLCGLRLDPDRTGTERSIRPATPMSPPSGLVYPESAVEQGLASPDPDARLAVMLGHASVTTTMRYVAAAEAATRTGLDG